MIDLLICRLLLFLPLAIAQFYSPSRLTYHCTLCIWWAQGAWINQQTNSSCFSTVFPALLCCLPNSVAWWLQANVPSKFNQIIIISCSGQLSGQQQTANIKVSKTSSVRDPDFSSSIWHDFFQEEHNLFFVESDAGISGLPKHIGVGSVVILDIQQIHLRLRLKSYNKP